MIFPDPLKNSKIDIYTVHVFLTETQIIFRFCGILNVKVMSSRRKTNRRRSRWLRHCNLFYNVNTTILWAVTSRSTWFLKDVKLLSKTYINYSGVLRGALGQDRPSPLSTPTLKYLDPEVIDREGLTFLMFVLSNFMQWMYK